MLVKDVMSSDVVTVRPADRAAVAAALMIYLGFSGLPVVERDGGVAGVITEIDLIRAALRGVDIGSAAVEAVTQRRPVFVEPDTDLETAAGLLEEWEVRRLPMCASGHLVGVLSRGDVLRALYGAAPAAVAQPFGRAG